MTLRYRLSKDDHATLDEPTRALYVEHQDGFRLDTDVAEPEDISGLKSALAKERQNHRQARHDLEIRETAWAEAQAKHEAEIVALSERGPEHLRDAEEWRLFNATQKAIAETPFRPLPDFYAKVRDRLHLADGHVRIWDESGQLPRRNADGSYPTVQQYMREIATDARYRDLWASLLAPPTSGSGAHPVMGTGGTSVPAPDVNRSKLSPLERAKLMKQLGSADYLNLPE